MALQPNPKVIDRSTIPLAVRRAAEEADRLQREATGQPDPGEDSQGEGRGQNPPEKEERPAPTHPEPGDRQEERQQERQETRAPEREPVEPGRGDPEDEDHESWRQRFLSEQGRTRKLREDLNSMGSRIDELQRLLAAVQTSTPASSSSELKFESLITDEDREQWGEVLPVIEKRAKELIAPLEAKLNGKIAELDGRLKHVGNAQVQDARSRMLEQLDNHSVVGGQQGDNFWRIMNDDDGPGGFVEWLQYPDRYSGRRRNDLLKEAFDLNDASRVAAFFEDFLKEEGRVAPRTSKPNGSAPPSPKPGLERFAAPGRPRSAPPSPGPADKEIITTGDITRFYADKTAGRFRGREKEADAYEREIFAAQSEGRVRPGPPSNP